MQIFNALKYIYDGIDSNDYLVGIFFDLAHASACVDSDILAQKLYYKGFIRLALNCLLSFKVQVLIFELQVLSFEFKLVPWFYIVIHMF